MSRSSCAPFEVPSELAPGVAQLFPGAVSEEVFNYVGGGSIRVLFYGASDRARADLAGAATFGRAVTTNESAVLSEAGALLQPDGDWLTLWFSAGRTAVGVRISGKVMDTAALLKIGETIRLDFDRRQMELFMTPEKCVQTFLDAVERNDGPAIMECILRDGTDDCEQALALVQYTVDRLAALRVKSGESRADRLAGEQLTPELLATDVVMDSDADAWVRLVPPEKGAIGRSMPCIVLGASLRKRSCNAGAVWINMRNSDGAWQIDLAVTLRNDFVRPGSADEGTVADDVSEEPAAENGTDGGSYQGDSGGSKSEGNAAPPDGQLSPGSSAEPVRARKDGASKGGTSRQSGGKPRAHRDRPDHVEQALLESFREVEELVGALDGSGMLPSGLLDLPKNSSLRGQRPRQSRAPRLRSSAQGSVETGAPLRPRPGQQQGRRAFPADHSANNVKSVDSLRQPAPPGSGRQRELTSPASSGLAQSAVLLGAAELEMDVTEPGRREAQPSRAERSQATVDLELGIGTDRSRQRSSTKAGPPRIVSDPSALSLDPSGRLSGMQANAGMGIAGVTGAFPETEASVALAPAEANALLAEARASAADGGASGVVSDAQSLRDAAAMIRKLTPAALKMMPDVVDSLKGEIARSGIGDSINAAIGQTSSELQPDRERQGIEVAKPGVRPDSSAPSPGTPESVTSKGGGTKVDETRSRNRKAAPPVDPEQDATQVASKVTHVGGNVKREVAPKPVEVEEGLPLDLLGDAIVDALTRKSTAIGVATGLALLLLVPCRPFLGRVLVGLGVRPFGYFVIHCGELRVRFPEDAPVCLEIRQKFSEETRRFSGAELEQIVVGRLEFAPYVLELTFPDGVAISIELYHRPNWAHEEIAIEYSRGHSTVRIAHMKNGLEGSVGSTIDLGDPPTVPCRLGAV